jgi:hypothetical protein
VSAGVCAVVLLGNVISGGRLVAPPINWWRMRSPYVRKEIEGGKPSATTKRRWDILFRYILNDGSFPVAPVAMRRPEGVSPIDGTHRMAVLSALRLIPEANFAAKKLAKPANEQQVWMGKHEDGDL